ncbi:ImmA/IrrE family metallo-endopeptidase [Aerococcus sp. UMB8623]|uniref:ImmA/IrrE family metallo-endopeptidase n=1 Tax=Aerococcus sp. UMB8623 TaxID=3046348 RepID=UPI00254E6E9B|nr:ImmA/IrrE family metallo-endopeptidase [Aerococcus sp. UMB8623]MDK6687214.1 ImmA/IrrE family metallo-endopeptidase [Aerococcus sp. UMB8623]
MSTARVPVNPRLIKYYMEQAFLTEDDLSKKPTFKKLEDWLSGKLNPTFKQLVDLSKELNVPVGYFFLEQPVDDTPDLIAYRTLESKENHSTASRELIENIQWVEDQQDFLSDYRQGQGFEKLDYVSKYEAYTLNDVEKLADESRKLLDLPLFWQKDLKGQTAFKYFRQRLNAIGTSVVVQSQVALNTHRSLDLDEFRAFVLLDDYAPFIFINGKDSENGRLFSLLHEFGHILLGQEDVLSDNELSDEVSQAEQLCNAFAAEILVPQASFLDTWQDQVPPKDLIEDLSRTFKVSQVVIARRALDAKLIDRDLYQGVVKEVREQFNQSEAKRKRTSGGPDFWTTLKSRLDPLVTESVFNAYYEGNIRYSDAANLLNLPVGTLNKLERRLQDKKGE